jgi:hypothetical protein
MRITLKYCQGLPAYEADLTPDTVELVLQEGRIVSQKNIGQRVSLVQKRSLLRRMGYNWKPFSKLLTSAQKHYSFLASKRKNISATAINMRSLHTSSTGFSVSD